jgi:hypothetical protein
MSGTTDKAQKLLDRIEGYLPFRVNEITTPKDQDVLATIRNSEGYPVLLPHPESQSILAGPREIFDYFEQSAGLIKDLLAIVASYEESSKPQRANSDKVALDG